MDHVYVCRTGLDHCAIYFQADVRVPFVMYALILLFVSNELKMRRKMSMDSVSVRFIILDQHDQRLDIKEHVARNV